MNKTAIQSAHLSWNEEGTPISEQFDDVYFSNQDGLEETRYVFLAGNGFPARFSTHPRNQCVIAETGFGTGLNFLTLWQSFQQFRQNSPDAKLNRLHFISFEKFPLQVDDLQAAHRRWPELAHLSQQLCAQWPLPLAGNHRIILENGALILDLWLGDLNRLLPDLKASYFNSIDSWFLDGFAPAKNQEMWSEQLFTTMAQTARENGTFSTFTSAGFVKRGLQNAGFCLKKIKGFGRKREMLTGYLPATERVLPNPWYKRSPASSTEDIAIIGGGIASLTTAFSLLQRGAKVALYCQDKQIAQNASGNLQGVLYPLFNGLDDELERFFISAYPFARRFYDQLAHQGLEFDHEWCGVTQVAYDELSQKKISAILNRPWPEQLVQSRNRQQLESICGLDVNHDGIHYALGGWLSPAQLCQNLLAYLIEQGVDVYFEHQVQAIRPVDSEWQLQIQTATGQRELQHKVVVIANGHLLSQFDQTETLPITAVRGQVSHSPSTPNLAKLKSVICYDGYLIPANANQQHCIGASFQRDNIDIEYSEQEQQQNKQRLLNCLPDIAWANEIDLSGKQARQGVRCAIRDHLPIVGNVPDFNRLMTEYAQVSTQIAQQQPITDAPVWPNLFIIGALGFRGLCSAPLCSELLAAQIFGEVLPLDDNILASLNPNRFWVRRLILGRKVKVSYNKDIGKRQP